MDQWTAAGIQWGSGPGCVWGRNVLRSWRGRYWDAYFSVSRRAAVEVRMHSSSSDNRRPHKSRKLPPRSCSPESFSQYFADATVWSKWKCRWIHLTCAFGWNWRSLEELNSNLNFLFFIYCFIWDKWSKYSHQLNDLQDWRYNRTWLVGCTHPRGVNKDRFICFCFRAAVWSVLLQQTC